MVIILMILAKISTSGLLRIKVFRRKSFDVIIYLHDVTEKVLSRNSNYIVDMAI